MKILSKIQDLWQPDWSWKCTLPVLGLLNTKYQGTCLKNKNFLVEATHS